MKVIPETRRSF